MRVHVISTKVFEELFTRGTKVSHQCLGLNASIMWSVFHTTSYPKWFRMPSYLLSLYYFISMVSPGYISSLFTCSLNEGVLEKKCTKGEVLC